MMELTACAFVVTFVSLVTATPYGYSVKGGVGAAARADSASLAGSFGGRGDIPEPVAFGNGFSGSFSKSSSSSSASSSASSSSSSYSFSGSGLGSFSSDGTRGGCVTGGCQNSNNKNVLSNDKPSSSAGVFGYNAENAGAAAGAVSGSSSGSDCHGPSCGNNVQKCSSGQCNTQLHTDVPDSKCSSGQCGSQLDTSPSRPTSYDSDDIAFVPHSSELAHETNVQSSNHVNTNGQEADSNCRGGYCKAFTSAPTHSFGPTSIGTRPHYLVPSIELQTPNQGSDCQQGKCKSGPEYGSLPSSYNVPINAVYNINEPKPGCTGGNCDKGIYSSTTINPLSTNYLGPHETQATKEPSNDYAGLPICDGSNCGTQPSINVKPALTETNEQHNAPSSNESALSPVCNSPSCKPYDINSPTAPHDNISPTAQTDNDKTEKDKLPVYTGGFGAPAGFLNPNEYHVPNNPSHTLINAPTSQPQAPSTSTICSSLNCFGPTSEYPGPSAETKPEKEKLPVYTGGFGAPTGLLKPDNFHVSATESNSSTQSSTTLQNQFSFDSAPTGCNYPNCISQVSSPSPSTFHTHTSNTGANESEQKQATYEGGFTGPAVTLKPNEFNTPTFSPSSVNNTPPSPSIGCNSLNCIATSPVTTAQPGSLGSVSDTSDKIPIYTGGFGGPPGMLNPIEHDKSKATPSPYHSHTSPSLQTLCKTSNCGTYATAAASADSQSEVIKSSTTSNVHTSSEHPAYTDGFGGPSGVLKPEFSDAHKLPNKNDHSFSSTTPSETLGCNSPNCQPSSHGIEKHPEPELGVTKPTTVTSPGFTTNYHRPIGVTYPNPLPVAPYSPSYTNTHPLLSTGNYSTGCQTGNCSPYVTTGSPTINKLPGTHDITKPSGELIPPNQQDLDVFGKPSVEIKPNENLYNVPAPVTTNCGSSTCGKPLLNVGAKAQSGSYAGVISQSPPFTNGYEKPTGSVKPNDYSTPGFITPSKDNNNVPINTPLGLCSSGNCNPITTAPTAPGYGAASVGVHASSAASSSAGIYTGGFGGPPGLLSPYDDGKLDQAKHGNGLDLGIHLGSGSIHSSHDTKPASNTAFKIPINAGSIAQSGSAAFSGALAAVNSGSYVKGNSPCGGGCNGGYPHALHENGNSAIAGSRSSNFGSFGVGGSFASAHSSAGAYTKGGYGKR